MPGSSMVREARVADLLATQTAGGVLFGTPKRGIRTAGRPTELSMTIWSAAISLPGANQCG